MNTSCEHELPPLHRRDKDNQWRSDNRRIFQVPQKSHQKQVKQAFTWIDDCKKTFLELKCYLSNPPLLSPSKEGEDLFLFLAVSATAVSTTLI